MDCFQICGELLRGLAFSFSKIKGAQKAGKNFVYLAYRKFFFSKNGVAKRKLRLIINLKNKYLRSEKGFYDEKERFFYASPCYGEGY